MSDVDLRLLAGGTPGLMGADLRNLVNEAALHAARRGQVAVRQSDLVDALEKILLGPARQVFMPAGERECVAYHESGHDLWTTSARSRSVASRVYHSTGMALGVTYQRPEEDRHNYSEHYLRLNRQCAGRARRGGLVYGERTTGAEDDTQQITIIARQIVTQWGTSDELGPVTLAPRESPFPGSPAGVLPEGPRPYSERTAEFVDAEVQQIPHELLRRSQAATEAASRRSRGARVCTS